MSPLCELLQFPIIRNCYFPHFIDEVTDAKEQCVSLSTNMSDLGKKNLLKELMG